VTYKSINISYITTTEEMVMNPDYKGWRQARIEVWTDDPNQHFAYEVGHIRLFEQPELFDAVREAIEGDPRERQGTPETEA
jgi:hypothetical protein